MYKQILVAIDLNDEGGWRQPLLAAAEHARLGTNAGRVVRHATCSVLVARD
jgi:nucleotide-binding universal stress UspA family protein